MKACETLWGRLTAEFGSICPKNMTNAERLRGAGLPRSKAECIARCAELFLSGEISGEKAAELSDREVVDLLTSIKGIGEWTAEMALIFCLKRPDVLSLSDYGIRKGLSLLHGMDVKDRKSMERFKKLYSPFGTAASIYLWEIAREY
jgi:DNA-3-methyladenine glycosylase II